MKILAVLLLFLLAVNEVPAAHAEETRDNGLGNSAAARVRENAKPLGLLPLTQKENSKSSNSNGFVSRFRKIGIHKDEEIDGQIENDYKDEDLNPEAERPILEPQYDYLADEQFMNNADY